jgi:hypothetical protein
MDAAASATQEQGSSAARASSRRALAPPLVPPLAVHEHLPPQGVNSARRGCGSPWSRAPLPDAGERVEESGERGERLGR